ncbi:hypothetical protein [Comamonas sp.]|uniref:hypothetical protein n=1 Tax=Comamonas sp. TaxID=34028 RepID=UPI00258E5B84|nr:hypothetical protein [Comamonas sp.]
MNQASNVAVTYTGKDDPFKDRIYRSGLTFTPGQTREVPVTLAERFLRHKDVFQRADTAKAAPAKAVKATPAVAQKPVDDTTELLDQAKKDQDQQRELDEGRFALIGQIEAMDRKAVIEWAQDHYKQKIPGNVSVAAARDMAKAFIDQYGMP